MSAQISCIVPGCQSPATALFAEFERRVWVRDRNLCEAHGAALLAGFSSRQSIGTGLWGQLPGATCVDIALLISPFDGHEGELILGEVGGTRFKGYGIGLFELSAIYHAVKRTVYARPVTHQAMALTINSLDGVLESVLVDETSNNGTIHHAKLRIRKDRRLKMVDIRPSDAFALAVYAQVPFFFSDSLFP